MFSQGGKILQRVVVSPDKYTKVNLTNDVPQAYYRINNATEINLLVSLQEKSHLVLEANTEKPAGRQDGSPLLKDTTSS